MENCNYRVIAVLREDLPEKERQRVKAQIADLMKRLHIVEQEKDCYCKEPPICGNDDFGAVAFFFAALKDMQGSFARLEHYDITAGKCRKAV